MIAAGISSTRSWICANPKRAQNSSENKVAGYQKADVNPQHIYFQATQALAEIDAKIRKDPRQMRRAQRRTAIRADHGVLQAARGGREIKAEVLGIVINGVAANNKSDSSISTTP